MTAIQPLVKNLQTHESFSGCPAIDQLIESSKTRACGTSEAIDMLEWISYSEFSDIERVHDSNELNIHYAVHNRQNGKSLVMLVLIGTRDECTLEFIDKFAKTYSLPTQKYLNPSNIVQYRCLIQMLVLRNCGYLKGFTMNEDKYFMVSDRMLHEFYSLYGFCSACGVLRCSSVWCMCGVKEVAYGWTSNCKKLDEFIRKIQSLSKTVNDSYVQFVSYNFLHQKLPDTIIPVDNDDPRQYSYLRYKEFTLSSSTDLVPLETSDLEDDSFYDKVKSYVVLMHATIHCNGC
jgi:hypothetical protein